MITKAMSQSWFAPPRLVVLLRRDVWRFAVYVIDGNVMDGRLPAPAGAPLEEAQKEVLAMLRSTQATTAP